MDQVQNRLCLWRIIWNPRDFHHIQQERLNLSGNLEFPDRFTLWKRHHFLAQRFLSCLFLSSFHLEWFHIHYLLFSMFSFIQFIWWIKRKSVVLTRWLFYYSFFLMHSHEQYVTFPDFTKKTSHSSCKLSLHAMHSHLSLFDWEDTFITWSQKISKS